MTQLDRPVRRAIRPAVWFLAVLLVGVGLVSLRARLTVAEPQEATGQERFITRAVADLMTRQHISRHPLDNEISDRWLTMYLKTLDPMKVYFTQSDVDEFAKRRYELDDMAREGNLDFGYAVFKRFLQRVEERVKLAEKLLTVQHDFTMDEYVVSEQKKAKYAQTDAEVQDLWRRNVKYDLLSLKAKKPPIEGQKAIEKLQKRYTSLLKRMRQIDNEELLEMYLGAMTTSYDPHTNYMSPDTLNNFEIQMRLNLQGIGAALQYNEGDTIVSKVLPGGAAAKDARLKKDDRVTGVGQGENGEIVNVEDMKLNDVVKLIRGRPGTVVRLQIIPEGQTEPKIYNIVRAQVELKDSEARSEIIEDGTKPGGGKYRVGVINLPSFYMDMAAARDGKEDFKSTTRDVRKLLEEFKQKGVDAVVVDLRVNGGGALNEAINLTGLFIETGPVVQVKDADGKVQEYDDTDPEVVWDGPLVVLISKYSASASEIFAGAIQDYHRGLVVGDRTTHGKGTVQTLQDIGKRFGRVNPPELGALKVTMQLFYRPAGKSTQNDGVAADVALPSLSSNLDVGESSLDYAIKNDQIQPAPFAPKNLVRSEMLDALRRQSAQRLTTSPDFAKVQKRIDRYLKRKEEGRISIREDRYMAERAELEAEKDEEDKLDDPNRPIVERNYYFNEALAVTLDYLQLLQSGRTATLGKR